MKDDIKLKKGAEHKMGLELFWEVGIDSVKNFLYDRELKFLLFSILFSSFAFIVINSYSSRLIEISWGTKYIGLVILLFTIQVFTLANFEIQRQTEINSIINKNSATVLSVFALIGSITGVIGSILFGMIADKYGDTFIFYYFWLANVTVCACS